MDVNLSLPQELKSRDPLALYMAKWFDEPFQADALTIGTGFHHLMTTVSQDRHQHADIFYEDPFTCQIIFIDAKMVTKGFSWIDVETKKKRYVDSLTIGEYAFKSYTPYFSFIWRDRVYLISRIAFAGIQPVYSHLSNGQNGHKQMLYHYDVRNLINHSYPDVKSFKILEEYFKLYTEAYAAYERARAMVYDLGYPKTQSERLFYDSVRMRTLTTFRDELIPIINKYNSISSDSGTTVDTSSVNDFNEDLENILSAIL